MAKDSRFNYEYRKNASKLHRTVGDLLRSDSNFKHLDSFQEYPVNKVNPDYPNGSHRFDWVIPKLRLVIECHGRQHYEVSTFGADVVDAIDSFKEGKVRDKTKKRAALAAGYRYIVVSFKEINKVTAELIFGKLKEADEELDKFEIAPGLNVKEDRLRKMRKSLRKMRKEHLKSDQHQQKLSRSRSHRREFYKRLKKLKDGEK